MQMELQNLSMTYPSGKQALHQINLALKAPSLIGLLGPNGAGKSTLMKLLVAALVPTQGRILIDGRPLEQEERQLKARLGYLPQDFGLFDELTVAQFLEERIHFRNLFSQKAPDRLVLLSTHIIEDVQSVCGQLVVMNHGSLLFTGTPEQLIQSAAGHVGVFWEQEAVRDPGLHITARVNTGQGIRCRAVADTLPAGAQPAEPTLEDAYLYFISREAAQ